MNHRRDVGLPSPVSNPSTKERMLIPWVCSSLDDPKSLREVAGQAVDTLDHHHHIPRFEHPADTLHEGRRIFLPEATCP